LAAGAVVLAAATIPGARANAAPVVDAGVRAPLSQSPASNLALILELIIRLIGGNPEELSDPRLSLTTKLNIVRGQYETYGIPQTLTEAEEQQLLDAILEAHLLLRDPEIMFEANEKAILLFDVALQDMWDELGGTPGGLDP
jgi:hypothetical protein